MEAAVVARTDPELGEVPVACVVAAPGGSLTVHQVIALFATGLAAYKHPRDVISLDRLPVTRSARCERASPHARTRFRGQRPKSVASARTSTELQGRVADRVASVHSAAVLRSVGDGMGGIAY